MVVLPHIYFSIVFSYSIFLQLAAFLSLVHSTLGTIHRPQGQFILSSGSGIPVLPLFLGEPARCSLSRPHLCQPHQHVSRGWSTRHGQDTGQAVPLPLGGTGDLVPPHRRNLPQWISNRKSSNTPMLLPTCPSKSFGTFWTQSMHAVNWINHLITSKLFCWGSLGKASGSLTLSCFASHYTCKASSLAFFFSWANSNSPSCMVSVPCDVPICAATFYARSSMFREPQDSHGDG